MRPPACVSSAARGLKHGLSPVTLADLAQCLASPGALADWSIARAINLDGGSSTGFFFDRGAGQAPVTLPPAKRIRNLLGIAPR
jgi:hypothetical protein